jgi:hypothetical protein
MAAEPKKHRRPLPDTAVDVEALARKVEELKKIGIVAGPERVANYVMEVTLSKKGVVDIHIKIPPIKEEREFAESIATLMFAVNSGKLRSMMADRLIEIAKTNRIEHEMASAIARWKEFESGDIEGPCIKPREVFG